MNTETILITERKPDAPLEEIQQLLSDAHRKNRENGLCYATAVQSPERLRRKIGAGVCLTATEAAEGRIVATITVTPRSIDYWYHSGPIGLIQLLGVHPDYQGRGLSQKLMERAMETVRQMGIAVAVMDSAEQNLAVRHLLLDKNDFTVVDCVRYQNNNFVSTVYAKWLQQECPWTEETCRKQYQMHRGIVEQIPGRP